MTELQTVADDLAEAVLGELAPDELEIFPIVRDEYWQLGRLPSRGGAAGGLNWDSMPGVASALAPMALALGSFALSLVASAVRQVSTEATKDVYGRIRAGLSGDLAAPPDLPGTTYVDVHRRVLEEAEKHLSPSNARALTDAIMERIARRAEGRS